MISVIHAPSDLAADAADDFYRIPAGGRRMEMDWDEVTRAFQSAVERLGWDAELEIRAEQQHVLVRIGSGCPESIGAGMEELYDVIEAAVGPDVFMSIGVDFAFVVHSAKCVS